MLDITTAQLTDACRQIYEPGEYRYAPTQLLIDHYAGDPPTTFLRAAFPVQFGKREANALTDLRELLLAMYGEDANVVFCVYFDELDAMDMARHALAIADR